jgi:hypothetical protein
VTSYEDGTAALDDEFLLERITALGRTIFTHDDDFLAIAAQWLSAGRPFAGVAYAHQLSITVGQAIRDLELIAEALDPADVRNRVVFLPL